VFILFSNLDNREKRGITLYLDLFKTKEYNKIVGRLIRKRRIWNDMTIELLAEKTCYSTNHISKVELGTSQPGIGVFHAICDVLEINATEFFLEVREELEAWDRENKK